MHWIATSRRVPDNATIMKPHNTHRTISKEISPQFTQTHFFHLHHHQAHTYGNMHMLLPPYIIAAPSEHISDYDVLTGRQGGRDDEPQTVVVGHHRRHAPQAVV